MTYDTVSALWRHPPEGTDALIPWRSYTERRTADGTRVTRQAGERGQVQIIRHPDGVLKVERSLPKALTGQNAVDLTQDQVPAALAAVGAELRLLAPGVEWPELGTLDPCRVDYCRSIPLAGSAEVAHALRRLAGLTLPWKGRPVVGESGSVAWPRGGYRPKAYSKGRETGDPRYANVLRLEVGAFGGPTLAHIPALLAIGSGRSLTLADVLVPQAATFVLERFISLVGGFEMAGEDLGDLEFFRAMVAFFGPRRAFGLIGLCVGWQVAGVQSWQEIEAQELGEKTTWYRARVDLRRFRDHLAGLGQEPGEVDVVQLRVAGLARLAA